MKTDKYQISFVGLECELSAPIIISKKEFKRQMDFLKSKVGTPVIDNIVVEYRVYEDDDTRFTRKRHYFTAGTADTELIEIHCKPGYHFSK